MVARFFSPKVIGSVSDSCMDDKMSLKFPGGGEPLGAL